jgi:hypothetical protein
MTKFVKRDGRWVDASTGEPLLTEAQRNGPIPLPYVLSDIDAYRSPIDGRVVNSRSDRRDDMKRHGCVEYEPSMSPTKGRIRNKAFAAKRGLKVSEEYR